MTVDPVATTDRLPQDATAIDQRHGNAIHFGLYPDILSIPQPGFNGRCLVNLVQASVGDRMRDGA